MLKRMPWPVILQIVPELSAGGAERTTIEMAEAVTLAGGRALVVSAGGRLEDELAEAGGELIRFPAKTKNPLTMIFNTARTRLAHPELRRKPGARQEPGACLERAACRKAHPPLLRDHLSRHL